MVENSSVLKTISFSNLIKWNVSELVSNQIFGKYKNSPLSKYLVRSKNAIEIKDDVLYKQITIHQYGEGVSLRCEKYGKEIGTKRQFVAKKGQFIISRIDARNGSFGIVSDFLDGAVVTNDFWLFDIKNADPQFLMLLLSSQKINSFWQAKSNGTTNRQRVDFEDFIKSSLPIPPLEEQRLLIQNFKKELHKQNNFTKMQMP
ncbi:MAG: restriction endonuclease subunit S [Treponema sp.]|nr:restriction endonuclease subunit S [Treponema sp.]